MVLKPYFLSVTLVAIFSTEATKTLLPYWFSDVLCFILHRTQVITKKANFTVGFLDYSQYILS